MFIAWPDIESFYNLRRSVKKYPHLLGDAKVITYRSKVKLHGTNAGIRVNVDKTVHAQSRTQTITPFNDNAGFARWVAENEKSFKWLAHYPWRLNSSWADETQPRDVIVYGEWCGPGIQSGVAINKIDKKIFAVFAVLHVESGKLIVEPMQIADALRFSNEVANNVQELPNDVKVIPWYSTMSDETNPPIPFQIDINFEAEEELLKPMLDVINSTIESIETCDPWVKKEFDVEGTGEGLVFYPVSNLSRDLFFKAKGEKHKVVAKTRPVQAEVPVAAGVQEFVELVLPLPRLEQGARAVANGELVFDIKKMGEFLKWIANDLKKETTNELIASGLDGKVALKACSERARNWYLEQVKNLGA